MTTREVIALTSDGKPLLAEVTELDDYPCVIWADPHALIWLSPDERIGAVESAIAEFDRVSS